MPLLSIPVRGRITDAQGQSLPRALVRTFAALPEQPDRAVAEATTNARGVYATKFAHERDLLPLVYVEVLLDDRLLGRSQSVAIENSEVRIDLQVDVTPSPGPVEPEPTDGRRRVYGTVRDEFGDLLREGTVTAFDRDLRNEQKLGSARLRDGQYEIFYTQDQFAKAEKGWADVVVKVFGVDGALRHTSGISFDAPEDLRLDVTLQGRAYVGPSEWEALNTDLLPLLDDVPPTDLREDDDFQDVSFLATETGTARLTIAVWSACYRLAAKVAHEQAGQNRADIPAEAFFAFLRQGQPSIFYDALLPDMQHPDRRALLEEKLVRGIAALTTDIQKSLLTGAIELNYAPARLAPAIDGVLGALEGLRVVYTADVTLGGGKGTVGQMLTLTPEIDPRQRTEFLSAFAAHSGPLDTFWKEIEENQVLAPDVAKRVRQTFRVGALTRNHVPLVDAMVKMLDSGEVSGPRDFARLDEAAWQTFLTTPRADGTVVGTPANVDGNTPEEQAATFSTILSQQFERAYATTAFSAKLQRSEAPPIGSKSDIVTFLDANPGFQLDRFRIDHYLTEHPESTADIADPDAMVASLQPVQRLFKLTPKFESVTALMHNNLDSAQDIYFLGQGQLLTALKGSSINSLEAKQLYRKAENAYALSLAMFADLNANVIGLQPFGVPNFVLPSLDKAKVEALPSLRTLFGTLDYCECADCRSVYSPAAYFVDAMRFLGARGTQGTGIHAGKTIQDVLLERRPDLGEIELSCENTTTPLPYIDLVNEVLEDAIAPPAQIVLNAALEPDLLEGPIRPSVLTGLRAASIPIDDNARVYAPDSRGAWVVRDGQRAYTITRTGPDLTLRRTRQTFLTAAELRANPEYTNDSAYDLLRTQVFPLDLPFDLWHLQSRTYLDRLGVPQPRFFELFQQRASDDVTLSPTDRQIDAAWLGLTGIEQQILTGTLTGKQSWDYWGLAETGNDVPSPDNPADTTANLTGSWIDVLSHVPVLLNRAAISYTELLQLIDTRYVNPERSLGIETTDTNTSSCDLSTFTVTNLTQAVLDRAHRFLRLWRQIPDLTMWELDLLLPDADPDPGTIDKQITDAALGDLSQLTRLRTRTGLDWRVLASFYANIDTVVDLDHGLEGAPPVQTLYARLFRNRLVDAVAPFPADPAELTGTVADFVPGLLAAFRIREEDLALVLADLGLALTSPLTLEVLSKLHRIVVLAGACELKVDGFLRLKRLWGQDPFASPAATRAFLELADTVGASGFTVVELDYLLAHRFTANSGVALEDKAIVTVLQVLRDGLQRISDDVRRKDEETAQAYVTSKIGLAPALRKDADQTAALALIDGTWVGTPTAHDALIDTLFAGLLDLPTAKAKLAPLPAGLSPADKQTAVDARFAYVAPVLEGMLLRTQTDAYVHQQVAGALDVDVPSATALLDTLHVPSGTVSLLRTLTDTRLIEHLPDGSYRYALKEADFPEAFKGLRLLHKDTLLMERLGMTASDVLWWLAPGHATGLGWPEPGNLPIDTTTSVPIAKWVALVRFLAWRKKLPVSDLTALEFADGVLDPAHPSADDLAGLARLTAVDPADLTALATAFHWLDTSAAFDVVKDRLRRPDNLVRLTDAAQALRKLGVQATRALDWAKPEPTPLIAEGLKQAMKAKYDLPQWQQVIGPVQDVFREKKRDAMVSYLVTHPDQAAGHGWADANGLYSAYLIDVEMNSPMLTSRIKQAASSTQLFVQRCLLNLEKDILAKTDLDPKWKQWAWMKRYRVWEANRKVFLYPENWIEPELRDEKSPFFVELEQELMQQDVTLETAEDAYRNYLEKLDKVANLEIRAMFDEPLSQDENVLHVFGRTRSSTGPEYFYRRRINNARWTAWEAVPLDITGNHLVAAVHNHRLSLLWPQFLEKAIAPSSVPTPSQNSTSTVQAPYKYWEVRQFWSELKKGKWTPKVLSDSFHTVPFSSVSGVDGISFRTRLVPYVQVRMFGSTGSYAPIGAQVFDKLGRQVTAGTAGGYEHLIAGPESWYRANLLSHRTANQYVYYGSVEESGKPHQLTPNENAAPIHLLGKVAPDNTFTVIDSQAAAFPVTGSFFTWDPRHTYFVDFVYRKDWSYFSAAWHERVTSSFQYFVHYHPFVDLFTKELNIWGLGGVLNRRIQVDPTSIPGSPAPFNFADYVPDDANVAADRPVENVDFSYKGAYSPYNWELFFHVPFLIANKLASNQRFEEALQWFHYIFDPTSTDTAAADPDTPQQKFWITKPFYETTKADYYKQKIENMLLAIAKGDAELKAQVDEWRDHPFNPHLIARMRTVAYQKNVLIKYLQMLIAWGDQLFGQDTIETINEAAQLYVLADSILGPRPRGVPRRNENPIKTFYQLKQDGIDPFGNVLKQVENLAPTVPSTGGLGEEAPELPRLDVLYFGIPHNDQLLTLWDTVADRMYKIRNSLNLQGVFRSLALFEPPIDPAALVRAAAAGLDVGSVLADVNAAMPVYRFQYTVQRAKETCAKVEALGNALLAALEKRDAEALGLLRSSQEQIMLDQVRLVRTQQVSEAEATRSGLELAKAVVEDRRDHFKKLIDDGWNAGEQAWLGLTTAAMTLETAGTVLNTLSASISLVPDVDAGAAGFGASPTVKLKFGGKNISNSAGKAAEVLKGVASVLSMGAGMAATVGSFDRRSQDWEHQKSQAEKEIAECERQIAAAEIRRLIAEQELANHDRQIEHAQAQDEFLHSKFTNKELYDWVVAQLSTVYFQSYQLAYDLAKRAERCFRYELGLSDSTYIRFGYWDSLRKGLLSGEKLAYDLQRLETAYSEQNRREYELTKHVSIGALDPVALMKLRRNGECFVDLPEALFDMDYPGHYFRRIKSVGLSIPAVAGPYTTVACTLTMTSNSVRKDSTLLGGKYLRDTAAPDPRFVDERAGIQSIATSTGRNDAGLFELNFRDERYLPFEGAGAVSSWHLKLNADLPQFDYDTISDAVLHIGYTAREGGGALRAKAVEEFNKKLDALALAESRTGLFRVLDLRREYPDKFYRFLHPANPADDQALMLDDLAERLPYFTRAFPTKKAVKLEVVAHMKDDATYKAQLSPLGTTPADELTVAPDPTYMGLHRATKDLAGSEVPFGAWTLKLRADGATDFRSLAPDAVDELFLVVNYTVA
ncbi:Tc toxin subunit A-related protein [Actinopolymorpha singaporensis]